MHKHKHVAAPPGGAENAENFMFNSLGTGINDTGALCHSQ